MKLETGRLTSKKKIYALLLAIFGASVALIGTVKVLANLFFSDTSTNCSHGHELDYCFANKTNKFIYSKPINQVSPMLNTSKLIITKTSISNSISNN